MNLVSATIFFLAGCRSRAEIESLQGRLSLATCDTTCPFSCLPSIHYSNLIGGPVFGGAGHWKKMFKNWNQKILKMKQMVAL